MTKTVSFTGQESPRFVRFGKAILESGVAHSVYVQGREPLTSRTIEIHGTITNAVFDGYIRFIEVIDEGSSIKYWVAGKNSTRSIATNIIEYSIGENTMHLLQEFAKDKNIYVPFVNDSQKEEYVQISKAVANQNEENLEYLLKILGTLDETNSDILFEAIVGLRPYDNFINQKRRRRKKVEDCILITLEKVENTQLVIPLIEDLGYIGYGSDGKAIEELGDFLIDGSNHTHVRWAAAIALGRYNSNNVVSKLIEGLPNTFDKIAKRDVDLLSEEYLQEHQGWVTAAILLGLSRRTNQEDQQLLEPLFSQFLSDDVNPILTRYACLGLSKLSNLESRTIGLLRDTLGNPQSKISQKGYAALALSNNVGNYTIDFEEQIIKLLKALVFSDSISITEPEDIWAVESLSELATLLEIHDIAAEFHDLLSDIFVDWRSEYYKALHYYEQAESAVSKGQVEDVYILFDRALKVLPTKNLPNESRYTISFRKDMITARRDLNDVLSRWLLYPNPSELKLLADSIKQISQIYLRYTQKSEFTQRQLSQKEIEYLEQIVKVLSIISELVELDNQILSQIGSLENWIITLQNISEQISAIEITATSGFSKLLSELIDNTSNSIDEVIDTIRKENLSHVDQVQTMRLLITELRTKFHAATWPMPARACPVTGLGKGTILFVDIDELDGDGISSNPLTFSADQPVVISTLAEIVEKTPGANTKALITLNCMGEQMIREVYVDEGTVREDFFLDKEVKSFGSIKVVISLIFETRDCNQVADTKEVYIRKHSS